METRALIIEDDHATQLLLEAVLRHEAIACDRAGDGAAALRRIAQHEYGAILLDLLLPGVNGFEVLAHLKKTRPDVLPRVIAITALNDSDWRDCDELRYVRCLLRKPLDIAELVGHVRACLDGHGNGQLAIRERQT